MCQDGGSEARATPPPSPLTPPPRSPVPLPLQPLQSVPVAVTLAAVPTVVSHGMTEAWNAKLFVVRSRIGKPRSNRILTEIAIARDLTER